MKFIECFLFAIVFSSVVSDNNDEEPKEVEQKDVNNQYYNPPFDPDSPPEPIHSKSGVRLVTINELKAHGFEGPLRPLWLAILGKVFDVDRAYDTHYGPNGGYNFFTGIDGSNAFVTGQFDEEGLIDDILQLTPLQIDEIESWLRFYNKEYKYVGKLIGRFYDETGNPTKYWYKYQRQLEKAVELKQKKKAEEHQFPPCNSRFTPEEGGTVYCSKKSGGIQRDWEGLPRRYFIPGTKEWRCACVNEPLLNDPHVKLYPGCSPEEKRCKVDKEKLRDEL